MDSQEGIFEIREYLDSNGNIENHDVRDITQELEYFSKLCADQGQQESELNEDDEFVRELALLADHPAGNDYLNCSQQNKDSKERSQEPAVSLPVATMPSEKRDVKSSGNSGWKKGFLQVRDKGCKAPGESSVFRAGDSGKIASSSLATTATTPVVVENTNPAVSLPPREAFSGNIVERTPGAVRSLKEPSLKRGCNSDKTS